MALLPLKFTELWRDSLNGQSIRPKGRVDIGEIPIPADQSSTTHPPNMDDGGFYLMKPKSNVIPFRQRPRQVIAWDLGKDERTAYTYWLRPNIRFGRIVWPGPPRYPKL